MTYFRIVSDLNYPNPVFRIQLGTQTFFSKWAIDFLNFPLKKRFKWTDFLQVGGDFFETTDFEKAVALKLRLTELAQYPQISVRTSFNEINIRNTFYEVVPSDH